LQLTVQAFCPCSNITERETGVSEDMTSHTARLRGFVVDLKTAILFTIRIPLGFAAHGDGADFTRAMWALPIAGAIVGSIAAIVYQAAIALGLPVLPAAALTVGAMLLATGALHEDGLADTADGFGGGATSSRKLDIMRDSRIGTYGACAVVMSLLLRTTALASIADPVHVGLALIAAHAAARAILPSFMLVLQPARADGLSATAGRPPAISAAAALTLGTIAVVGSFSLAKAAAALILVTLVFLVMAWLCKKQIGGQTGDTLGALEQITEVSILFCAVVH
jgi:adenosylcobinamide-GDP ribazoletransferase